MRISHESQSSMQGRLPERAASSCPTRVGQNIIHGWSALQLFASLPLSSHIQLIIQLIIQQSLSHFTCLFLAGSVVWKGRGTQGIFEVYFRYILVASDTFGFNMFVICQILNHIYSLKKNKKTIQSQSCFLQSIFAIANQLHIRIISRIQG